MLKLLINGVDRTEHLINGSLSISDALNERSVASMSLVDKLATYRPEVGQVVEIMDGEDLIFAGTIDDVPEFMQEGTNVMQFVGIPIIDFHHVADRRLVAEAFEGKTAGYIVNYILTNYLADEGIIAGDIQEGVVIQDAVFNYLPVSTCMDELSELTGFQWRIKPDKTLDFFDRSSYTGTPISETSAIKNLRVKKSREQYRNRQYLRAGQDVSTVQTRTFKGDGETQTFAVELPIAKVPTIKVNGVTQTVGIRSLEEGKQWYWQKNDKIISQDSTGTKLTSSDTLTVEFQGFYPIMTVLDDFSGMSERKGVEGGTGVYESMVEKPSLNTRESALAYTEGLLRRFASIKTRVTFETYELFKSGELIQVDLPSFSISEEMLVASVQINDVGSLDGRLLYRVELVSGESFGGWTNFFKKLSENKQSYVIRENEVVIKMSSFADKFVKPKLTDSLVYTLHQYLVCNTNQYCGQGVII